MRIALVVAMSLDNAIGKNNQLLWHLSSDLKRFKALTTGHTIIMGRKTYDSLPNGALPNRRNIVVSRSLNQVTGVELAHSLAEAFDLAKAETQVFVIGGGDIYRQSLASATDLHLTVVDAKYPDADTFFPEINLNEWELKTKEVVEVDERNPLQSTYYHYIKKN